VRPLGFRSPLLRVLLLGLALGVVIGLGLGRATLRCPGFHRDPPGGWIVTVRHDCGSMGHRSVGGIGPDAGVLGDRETSAGLAPVVCTHAAAALARMPVDLIPSISGRASRERG
jgi:hypothetical protein